jgi:hypothetical protein
MHFLPFLRVTAVSIASASMQAPVKYSDAAIFEKNETYPRAVKLAERSLLGVYAASGNENRAIITVKSTAGRASWGPLGAVIGKTFQN